VLTMVEVGSTLVAWVAAALLICCCSVTCCTDENRSENSGSGAGGNFEFSGSVNGDFDMEVGSEYGDVGYTHASSANSDTHSDTGSYGFDYSSPPTTPKGADGVRVGGGMSRSNSINAYRMERSSGTGGPPGRSSFTANYKK
jgi:hypothetical protein